MPEINRQQHRERVRKAYLNNSFESMPDSNVLEMVLFYAIPRKDVKDVSYALINRFGSLEGVLSADIKELVKVEGVGENTAILINLIHNIDKRLDKNKNKSNASLFTLPPKYVKRGIIEKISIPINLLFIFPPILFKIPSITIPVDVTQNSEKN